MTSPDDPVALPRIGGTVMVPAGDSTRDAVREAVHVRAVKVEQRMISLTALVEFLKEFWAAFRQERTTFLKAITNPTAVIQELGVGRHTSVEKALKLTLFSVFLAFVVDTPYFTYFAPQFYSYANVVADASLYYVQMFIWTFSLYLFGRLFGGKGSLTACWLAVLVFSVYWPLNELLSYTIKTEPDLLCARFYGPVFGGPKYKTLSQTDYYYIWWSAGRVFCLIFVAMTFRAISHLHKVGWIRGLIITLLFAGFGSLISEIILYPVYKKMFEPTCVMLHHKKPAVPGTEPPGSDFSM